MKVLAVLILIYWIHGPIRVHGAKIAREFSVRNWANCPIKTLMVQNMTTPKVNIDNITITGPLYVSEEITGNIEMVLETNKCSLDMKKCEKYSNHNIPNMCTKFMEKNSFYSSAFASIHPPLRCPIKPGNYTCDDSVFDMSSSVVRMLPLDGYVWVITFKLVASESGSKTKRVVFCLNTETKIAKIRVRS